MLSLCLIIIIKDTNREIIKGTILISNLILLNMQTNNGYDTETIMDDNETIFEMIRDIKKMEINIIATLQSTKKMHAHVVNIPFPPLNLKKHGNICPKQQNNSTIIKNKYVPKYS